MSDSLAHLFPDIKEEIDFDYLTLLECYFTEYEVKKTIDNLYQISRNVGKSEENSNKSSHNTFLVFHSMRLAYHNRFNNKNQGPIREQYRYKKWAKSVLQRDGNKCLNCNATEKLEAHHIQNFKNHPDLIFILENGITLCSSCHAYIHKISEDNLTLDLIKKEVKN